MAKPPADHRRATAERNADAIVDAAEALLARGAATTTSAVAAEAGVSRVTLYAHFPTREALLEAVVARAVRAARAAVEEATQGDGGPLEELDRLAAVAWSQIDRSSAATHAAAAELSPAALARAHEQLRAPLAALVRRGREAGELRADVPEDWLVSVYFAIVHAYAAEVRRGALPADDAVRVLRLTLRGALGA